MENQPLTACKQYCLAVPMPRDNKATSPTRKTLAVILKRHEKHKKQQ